MAAYLIRLAEIVLHGRIRRLFIELSSPVISSSATVEFNIICRSVWKDDEECNHGFNLKFYLGDRALTLCKADISRNRGEMIPLRNYFNTARVGLEFLYKRERDASYCISLYSDTLA